MRRPRGPVAAPKDGPKELGRRAYAERAWGDACDALSVANAEGPLDLEDAERLAFSTRLAGRGGAGIEAFEELHRVALDAGDLPRAARAAFWASMRSFSAGERSRGVGWAERARRLAAREAEGSVERGYVRLPEVYRLTAAGDHGAARAAAREAAEIGIAHHDRDLTALGRAFEGRALIRHGRRSEGLPILDEAMVGVRSGEVSPVVSGIVYCAVIAACRQSHAVDRAREWTDALHAWCNEQPQLVAFSGQCLVHRSEILLLGGAWREAEEEARRAADLGAASDLATAEAHLQLGELHRLRGEHDAAERAYALASERGREPQPGLALLRLAQGRADLAAASSCRVLATAAGPIARAAQLPAHVEILLGAADVCGARVAADELGHIARELGAEALVALADHADGSVRLAERDASGAIEPLRRAESAWRRIGAPYGVARVRVDVARAFLGLGDEDGAKLELRSAEKVFAELGAAPDLAAVRALLASSRGRAAHGLSAREIEVLRLVTTGRTNKAIALELGLAEKTIDRHVSNLLAKLGVPSRAAATAWAVQHGVRG